jgi:hypothetical protein
MKAIRSMKELRAAAKKHEGKLKKTRDGYAVYFYNPKLDDCGIIFRFPDERWPEPIDYDAHFEEHLKKIRKALPKPKKKVVELICALEEIIEPSYVTPWLMKKNKAFGGEAPIDLIHRGELDKLWNMVWEVRGGVQS